MRGDSPTTQAQELLGVPLGQAFAEQRWLPQLTNCRAVLRRRPGAFHNVTAGGVDKADGE